MRVAMRASDSAREPVASGTACGRARFNAKTRSSKIFARPQCDRACHYFWSDCSMIGMRARNTLTRTNPPHNNQRIVRVCAEHTENPSAHAQVRSLWHSRPLHKRWHGFWIPSTFQKALERGKCRSNKGKISTLKTRGSPETCRSLSIWGSSHFLNRAPVNTMGRLLRDAKKGNNFLRGGPCAWMRESDNEGGDSQNFVKILSGSMASGFR